MLSNTNALTEFLPDVLGRFLAAHPLVTVDLQERLSDEIVGLVAEGAAELGIVAATADTSAVETYPFRTDRFVLVVPRMHALAGRARSGQRHPALPGGACIPSRCTAAPTGPAAQL
jgi:DNA-binding transcriptional LysR family regulator